MPDVNQLPPPPRRPKQSYRGTNGFTDPIRLRVQGLTHLPNLHEKPPGTDDAAARAHTRRVRDAVERRRFGEDVLQLKGTYFPGVAAAKEMDELPETSTSVKERMKQLQERHFEEMQTLHDWQAQDYLEESRDMYLTKDVAVMNTDIDSFYKTLHAPRMHMIEPFDEAVSSHRYAHLSTLAVLRRQQSNLMTQEDNTRRRLDAKFPADISEYRAIRNKDIQIRVARFLTSDSNGKDKMMSEFQWAWRQVKALSDEYAKNVEFQAEIQDRLREVEARDPRRKPSTAG